MNRTCKLYAVEGPDGVGKTTAIAHLSQHLKGRGVNYEVLHPFRFNGFTKDVHHSVLTGSTTHAGRLLAMLAALAEVAEYHEELGPGAVIVDRWTMSTRIYNAWMEGREPSYTEGCIRAALGEWANPDMYIVLNADAPILLRRKRADYSIPYEAEMLSAAYKQAPYYSGGSTVNYIDTDQLTEADVARRVAGIADKYVL